MEKFLSRIRDILIPHPFFCLGSGHLRQKMRIRPRIDIGVTNFRHIERVKVTYPYILIAVFLFACSSEDRLDSDFQIEAGFSLTRVAEEPLIVDPVDIEFNEKGDAFVLEMPGYPFEDKQSRILVLMDEDADGIYDGKKVFIEGMQLANSFMPYRKGLLVAAPPYLLFVRDDDQDYVPESVDTLMGGFSTGNLQHNYNGLTYGLDDWIYAANGGNDGSPFWWDDSTTKMGSSGTGFQVQFEDKKHGASGRVFGWAWHFDGSLWADI